MRKVITLFLFFTLFAMFPAIITFAQDIQQGNATWYEDDSHDLNASHARFPPGTRLRVTNLNNQKEAYVTVNNRIQNSDNRILDVSQEVATLLGMNKRGSTPIRLVVIRGLMAEPEPSATETVDESSYYDEPVPEITAVSPGYEDFENDYKGYESYESFEDDYSEEIPPTAASAETPPSSPPPIRAFPQQPAPQSQPETAAQPQSEAQVLLKKIVVLINGKEQTIDIPDGVYIPLPVTGSAPPTSVYTPSAPGPVRVYIPSAPPPPPPRTMPVPPPVQPAGPVIKIIPKLPDPHSGKVYRVQVGAFSRAALAQACFDRLKSAGFTPAFEQSGSLYRVVISGIKAADVSYTAQRLNAAGFTEAWIREESRH